MFYVSRVITLILCVAAASLWANPTQADIIVDQASTGTHGVDEDIVEGASWKLSDLGFTVTNGPIPQTASLLSVAFEKGTWGGTPSTGGLYLKVFTGATGGTGTYVGISNNTVDCVSAANYSLETWTFSSLALNKDTTYSYVVSASNDTSNPSEKFRVMLSPQAANPETSVLTSGTLISGDAAFNANWDAVLHITLASVPEPSTIVLLATGLLGLLAYAWRKRK